MHFVTPPLTISPHNHNNPSPRFNRKITKCFYIVIYYRIIFALVIATASFMVFPLHAQTQKGKASFYSKRATGSRTSSGERLHHDSLTCAHRTYPFGTLLKVTNERNGKWVVVRVTDRGPHSRGRIIDLSHAAAKRIGIINQGVATVKVERYHDSNIPYRLDEKDLPEIDFEVTEYTLPENGVLHFPKKGKQYNQYVKIVDDDDDENDSTKIASASKKNVVEKHTTSKKKSVSKKKSTSKKKKSTSKKKSSKRRR